MNEKLSTLMQAWKLSREEAHFLHACYCEEKEAEEWQQFKTSRLFRWDILGVKRDSKIPVLRLESAVRFLDGEEDINPASLSVYNDDPKTYSLESYPVSSRAIQLTKALLSSQREQKIRISGEPGTGKSRFALSLLKDMNIDYERVTVTIDRDSPLYHPILDFMLFATLAAGRNKVLILDEADFFLKYLTSPRSKMKEDFMDHIPGKTFWILNDDMQHQSLSRNSFSYSINFDDTDRTLQSQAWNGLLSKSPLSKHLSETTKKRIINRYPFNFSSINKALETTESVLDSAPDLEEPDALLQEILSRQNPGRESVADEEILKPLNTHYDRNLIKTDIPAGRIRRILNDYRDRPAQNSMNLLFWGEPGTGKTEFAKYLATEIEAPLMVKRASDLISCLVGKTPKNIAQCFREAEKEKAILLLDEADSLFLRRDQARNYWEVTQTNQLLTEMENYNGILICCTNLLKNLDSAALRRFTFKIHFSPPDAACRVALFSAYFPEIFLVEGAEKRLRTLEGLTPGDFFTVKSLYEYQQASPFADQIINDLERELSYRYQRRETPIGFAAS